MTEDKEHYSQHEPATVEHHREHHSSSSIFNRITGVPHTRLFGFAFAILFAVIGASILLYSYAATPPTPSPVEKIVIHDAANSVGQQMCLDDYQDQDANGTPVISYPCNSSDPAQQWTLYSNGTIRIHDTECLDTLSPFNQPGAKVITYVCNNGQSQTQVWSAPSSSFASTDTTELTNGDSPHLCLTNPQSNDSGTQLVVAQCTTGIGTNWIVQQYQNVSKIEPGVAALQSMYNDTAGSPSRGLFCTGKPGGACWWDSANELNSIINYTEQTGNQQYLGDIATTYSYAGKDLSGVSSTLFTDRYNDDDGWWALTWLNAYKLTGSRSYLQTAEGIYAYIQANGWTSACGGGVLQFNGGVGADGEPPTKDAIANGLYVTLAARLFQATGNASYLNSSSGAIAAANWFLNSGLILSSGTDAGLVEDHLINSDTATISNEDSGGPILSTASCVPAVTQKSTYSQGLILEGLANLYQITGNAKYLDAANTTANAVLTDKSNTNPPLIDANGVLTEPCTGAPYNCNLSSAQSFLQWKGPLVRGLYCLNEVAPTSAHSDFFATNANALLSTYGVGQTASPVEGVNARGLDYFGFSWDEYTTAQLGAATQGSALDALNANLGGSDTMCSG